MITTVEGQTVWTFTEPTLEQITSGDYTLPVNFKVVDINTSTYKLISFVADSQNGARRLELGCGSLDQENIPRVISITLEDLGMTSSNTEAEINQALADYINGLNLTIGEKELYFFQVDGFPDATPSVEVKPYKVYTALLTQSGTDAPVATVLENTLGESIVWQREGVGEYQAFCSLLLDTDGYSDNKAFSNIFGYKTIQGTDSPTSTIAKYSEQWFETGVIKLATSTYPRGGGNSTFEDGLLYFMPIEIRIYN